MSAPGAGALVAAPGSPVAGLAAGLAWLWALDAGTPRVGLGDAGERERLERLVAAGELRGAIVIDHRAEQAQGEARFDDEMRLRGTFGLLEPEGEVWARSSLGVHATVTGSVLTLAAPADGEWGTLRLVWVASAVSRFLDERLGLQLRRLPPVGCIRLDDVPGTAEFQLEGRAKDDATQTRLASSLVRAATKADAVLNVAVACEALGDERTPVPLELVWPGSIARLRAGVESGAIEPVCHGRLGLVRSALERGEIDFHEYGALGEAEAEAVLRDVAEWQRSNLGEAPTFVAVDWTYSEGTRAAARRRGLTAWLAPSPGPLVEDGAVRETLIGTLDGIAGLDFSPLRLLARLGVPPTVTLHGRSLDRRRESFSLPRDAASLLGAVVKRDIFRLLALDGVDWVGAAEFARELREHPAGESRS